VGVYCERQKKAQWCNARLGIYFFIAIFLGLDFLFLSFLPFTKSGSFCSVDDNKLIITSRRRKCGVFFIY